MDQNKITKILDNEWIRASKEVPNENSQGALINYNIWGLYISNLPTHQQELRKHGYSTGMTGVPQFYYSCATEALVLLRVVRTFDISVVYNVSNELSLINQSSSRKKVANHDKLYMFNVMADVVTSMSFHNKNY